MARYKWTRPKLQAAELVAQGELTVVEIAGEIGVSFQAIYNWLKHPAFQAKIDERIAEIGASVNRRKISRIDQRIEAYNRVWIKLEKLIERRLEEICVEAAVKELRDLGKQAAQELGQWQDRVTFKSQPTDEPTLSPEQASAALDAINGCDPEHASDSSDPAPDA